MIKDLEKKYPVGTLVTNRWGSIYTIVKYYQKEVVLSIGDSLNVRLLDCFSVPKEELLSKYHLPYGGEL